MGDTGIIEGIAGGIAGLVNSANLQKEREKWDLLPATAGFKGEGYQKEGYAGDFNPALYGTPEAAQYQTISEDPRTRDYQMQALARMQGYADNAANSAESLGRYNAISDANALAAQREAGIRNQMAMRGQGGSGMEFVLQSQAGQDAANRAQSGALNAAQQAALQRLAGTQGVMQGASNVRGMDANVAGRNADIINQFNMANTNQRNATNNANVNLRNGAGMRNVEARQGLMGRNTGISNSSLDRSDRNKLTDLNTTRQQMGQGIGLQQQINQGSVQGVKDIGAGVDKAGETVMKMFTGGMMGG